MKKVASIEAKNSGKISALQKIPMKKLIIYRIRSNTIPIMADIRCFLVYMVILLSEYVILKMLRYF